MRKILIGFALIAATVLTGCGEDTETYPPVQTYDNIPVEEDTSTPTDDEIAVIVMETQWNSQTPADRDLMCNYYITDHDGAMADFAQGAEWDASLIAAMDDLMAREC